VQTDAKLLLELAFCKRAGASLFRSATPEIHAVGTAVVVQSRVGTAFPPAHCIVVAIPTPLQDPVPTPRMGLKVHLFLSTKTSQDITAFEYRTIDLA